MSSIGSSGPTSWHARLIQAAGKGDEVTVRDLVSEGYPNDKTYTDALRTALQRVVSRGSESLSRFLLERGAQLNATAEGEVSPLHRAAELGHERIVKALIEHGADPNSRDKIRQTPIFPAAQRGHPKVLTLLLEAGAEVNVRDEDGQTLMLCLAAEKAGKSLKWGTEIIDILLRTDLDLEIKDKDGRTALLWAAATGKETLVKLLLTGRTERKADIKAANHRGKTALHLAVESKSNRVAIMKLLLQYDADVRAQSDGNWTALHNAAEKGYEDVVSLLLEWKANVNATTSSGMTALHWSSRNGHIEVVKLLLRQQGIRVHRKDSFDETPMLGAAQNGHMEIARLLSPTNDGANLSLPAQVACRGFQATVVDFGMEHRPMNHRKHSVFDVLYGWDEDKQKPLVTTLARNVPAKPAFRWIHLPTNNLAWVETLVTKHFIEDSASDVDGFKAIEKLLGQQHQGPTVHSFFMRPLCQRMQPTGKNITVTKGMENEMGATTPKPEVSTPIIILPDQENDVKENQKPANVKLEKKSSQGERTPRGNKPGGTSKAQANNASKRANESAALSSKSQRKKAEGHPAGSRTPTGKSETSRRGNIILFMPYLHYETHRNRKTMSEAIKRTMAKDASLGSNSTHNCDEMLIDAYLRSTPNLHIRRTLDQFYYHAISTEGRDTDQVVYRYTREKGKEKKVFMVDQLWICILGDGLIITSFPQRWAQPKDDPLNVLDGIIEDMNSKTRPPVKLGDEEFQFLDMFESSIGHVTNKETELFMNFNDASKAAARWLTNQRQRGSLQNLSKHSSETENLKDHTFVDTLLDIGEETALLAETKDIRDELNMISMVLKHQVSILDDMMHALLEEAKGPDSRMQAEIKKRYREQHKVVEVHLKDVERMDKQAEGIYTSLTHLLDLKQKHANAFEARFARDQAAFTGRQGQTIMVFTIVTIVFLPMSFIAAVFTIPVSEFPHSDGAPSIPFSYVSKITFGVGLAISIPLIAVAFALDNIGVLLRRTLRSMVAWRSPEPVQRHVLTTSRTEKEEVDSDEDVPKPTLLGRVSGDAYRRRTSTDLEQETRPMRRSIYSKDRRRDSLRISADLERGDIKRLRSN
ncbi:MAG: hypothetical protein Q9169_004274 [Polycauliona sp. 2 TL-2023]